MKKITKLIVPLFISGLMIFTVLLIGILVVYIVNKSFPDSETILAGVLGFVGAIFGGIISGIVTLEGVKRTIDFNYRIERSNRIPGKITAFHELKMTLYKIINYTQLEKRDIKLKRKSKTSLESFVNPILKENDLYSLAAEIDPEIYKKVYKMRNQIKFHLTSYDGKYKSVFYTLEGEERADAREQLITELYNSCQSTVYKTLLETELVIEDLMEELEIGK